MKRPIYLALIVVMLSGLSACTSYDYYTAAINKTNLSNYHTFAWMPPANSRNQTGGNIADAKIKDAATNALVMKGLQLSQRNPDLVVNYTTKVGTGTRTDYYSPYYGGFYPGWGWGGGFGWGWGFGYRGYYNAFGGPFAYNGGLTYAEQEHYKEGTLIIDLIDRRTRKIVWRGFGVGEVHKNQEKNIEDLPKVVDGVLAQLQLSPDQMRMRRSYN
jgi:hypothetical protein